MNNDTKRLYSSILGFNVLSLGLYLMFIGTTEIYPILKFSLLPFWLKAFCIIYIGIHALVIFFIYRAPSKAGDRIFRFIKRHLIVVYVLKGMFILFGITSVILIGLPLVIKDSMIQQKNTWLSLYSFPNIFVGICMLISMDFGMYANVFYEGYQLLSGRES